MAWDRETERKAGKTYHMTGSLFGVIFSIFWCIAAASMGAWFMLIFGIPFTGMMIFRLVMGVKYMKSEEMERKPTLQADPWEQESIFRQESGGTGSGYCPYCGSSVEERFFYCPKCGRNLK